MPSPSLRPLLEQRKSELQREIAAAKAGNDSLMLSRTDDFRALTTVLSRFEDADRDAAGLLGILKKGGSVASSCFSHSWRLIGQSRSGRSRAR